MVVLVLVFLPLWALEIFAELNLGPGPITIIIALIIAFPIYLSALSVDLLIWSGRVHELSSARSKGERALSDLNLDWRSRGSI